MKIVRVSGVQWQQVLRSTGKKMSRAAARSATVSLVLVLAACGIGSPPTYTVGGTVAGLFGSGLVLQLNGSNDLTITSNGSFIFPSLNDGSSYVVVVKEQPTDPHQVCEVTNGSGTLNGENESGVIVRCSPWTKQLGAPGASTSGFSVSADVSGNVYIAGYTEGGLDGNTLTGTVDAFLTKYDALGNRVFTKQMGVAEAAVFASAVTTDRDGNVYVAGTTEGSLEDNALTGTTDFFIIQYDAAGNRGYTRQLGVTGGITQASSVDSDAEGNIYIAGFTEGGLDGNTQTGAADFFLTKYDPLGNKVYTRQMGATGANTAALSVATDESGNVYVVGFTSGHLDGNTLAGGRDCFLSKYDVSGSRLYTRQMGVKGGDTLCYSVATDAGGNIYVAGGTSGNLEDNTLVGAIDLFLAKYDAAGTRVYVKQMGARGVDTLAYSIATDVAGNAYVTGYTEGALDGNPMKGRRDVFLTKYDASGNKEYTEQMGTPWGVTTANGITIDSNDNVFIAGDTQGALDGNTQMGTNDFFVVKYDTAGSKQ